MREGKKLIDLNRIKNVMSHYNYISFDLFDTLIKRDCCQPTELFYFMEKKIDHKIGRESHFAKQRIRAEIIARKTAKTEEVTLEEIYENLSGDFSYREKNEIIHLEKEYEYNFCQWNPFLKPIYEYCIKERKKIIIVTDIYLPEELIRKILVKLNIEYMEIFVSSTERKMKASGTLFHEVLRKLRIKPTELLHVGDNKRSDYRVPKSLGIQVLPISKEMKVNLFIDKKIYKDKRQYANLCAFINNHSNSHSWDSISVDTSYNFFSETGYEAEGPVLYGYINWLQEQFRKDGIEKVFFLARDGQLMQKAYRKLNENLPNTYMYASRKALIIPSLWMIPTIPEIAKAIYWERRGNIADFLKKIGLTPIDFKEDFAKAGFSLNIVYKYEQLWQNVAFLHIFEKYVKEKMIMHSREMYNLLIKYLRQINFTGKVAVVDIGWFGHMQGALEKIIKTAGIPAEIHGYYLGIRPESPMLDFISAQGYLFDRSHHEMLSAKENIFYSMIEILFTADHGTTKGYKLKGDSIIPVIRAWEYDNSAYKEDYVAIQACQEGALAFIDDMLSEKDYFLFDSSFSITFVNWLQLGNYPSIKAVAYFGNLHFLDDKITCLAKPKAGSTYLRHPQMFLQDFRDSVWRMGFLTRLWGDKIPYARVYKGLKRLFSF